VAYEQSVWIVDRLLSAGVPAELETIAGADHGFKGADEERAEVRMIEFLGRYLK
jgi:dipeptidyl aminopeptidase/acylaminoacyl peptidase